MIKNVLFDMDNTLYRVDEAKWLKGYFAEVARVFTELGYDGKKIAGWVTSAGVAAMVNNNGMVTNATAFWKKMEAEIGIKRADVEPALIKMYREQWQPAVDTIEPKPEMNTILEKLTQKKKNIILATNPILPGVATERRLNIAGINPKIFSHITTYENSCFAKPNVNYYKDLVRLCKLQPRETLMVGNDPVNDKVIENLGIRCFLLNDENITELQNEIDRM